MVLFWWDFTKSKWIKTFFESSSPMRCLQNDSSFCFKLNGISNFKCVLISLAVLLKFLKCHSNVLTLLLIFNQQCTFRESSVRRKRQSLTALRDYISGKKKYHVISEKKKLCNRSYLWLSPIMRLVLKFLLQIKNKLGFRITDEHRKVNGKLFMSMKVGFRNS